MSDLGDLYRCGHCMPQSFERAATWFEQAALQGRASAQCPVPEAAISAWPCDAARPLVLVKQAAGATSTLIVLMGMGEDSPMD